MVGKRPLVESNIWAGVAQTQRIGALLDENDSRQNHLEFMRIVFVFFVYCIFLFSFLQSWNIETTSTNDKWIISNLQDLNKLPWALSPSFGRSWGKGCKELKYLLYWTLCVSHAILQSERNPAFIIQICLKRISTPKIMANLRTSSALPRKIQRIMPAWMIYFPLWKRLNKQAAIEDGTKDSRRLRYIERRRLCSKSSFKMNSFWKEKVLACNFRFHIWHQSKFIKVPFQFSTILQIVGKESGCQNKHLEIWENVGGQKYEIILLICCTFEGEVLDLPIFNCIFFSLMDNIYSDHLLKWPFSNSQTVLSPLQNIVTLILYPHSFEWHSIQTWVP